MKLRTSLSIFALAVASSSAVMAQGQVSTGTDGANAPKKAWSFSPTVASGARTYLSNKIGDSEEAATTFGPYLTPALSLDYKVGKLKTTLSYEAELSGAKGFGSASKSLSVNSYIHHHPVFVGSLLLTPSTQINVVSDNVFRYYDANKEENYSEIFLQPELEQKISSTTSLAGGYVLHRVSNFDSALKEKADATVKASTINEPSAKAAALNNLIGDKQNILHAGVLTMRNTIGEQKLTTYVRAGKRIGNEANVTANSYRFQTELAFTSPIKALTGALRYRFNIEDQDTAELKYYNLGRVVASYELSSSWSIDLLNEIALSQNTVAGAKAALENENYLGVTYKF